ncbi:MAG: hypothetical protein LUH14_07150 [Clostridiaceae bacterium]|nr:hypothetical protein [Clostridiaceae bacterium]
MQSMDIKVELAERELWGLLNRYHFQEKDFSLLQSFYLAALPLLHAKAYYLWKQKDESSLHAKAYYLWKQKNEPSLHDEYLIVFLTLGDAIDELQEIYASRKCLTEAYVLECLALEFLEKAYGEFIRQIQKESGKWAIKIDFLGDTYPIELLPELYRQFGEMDIRYNEKLVLSPAKSVVFFLPMSEKQAGNGGVCRVCDHCGNISCVLRRESIPMQPTYGYQRIFGQEK